MIHLFLGQNTIKLFDADLNNPPADSFVQLLIDKIIYGRFKDFVIVRPGDSPLVFALGSGQLPGNHAGTPKCPITSNPILDPAEVTSVRTVLPYLVRVSVASRDSWIAHLVSEVEVPRTEEEEIERPIRLSPKKSQEKKAKARPGSGSISSSASSARRIKVYTLLFVLTLADYFI